MSTASARPVTKLKLSSSSTGSTVSTMTLPRTTWSQTWSQAWSCPMGACRRRRHPHRRECLGRNRRRPFGKTRYGRRTSMESSRPPKMEPQQKMSPQPKSPQTPSPHSLDGSRQEVSDLISVFKGRNAYLKRIIQKTCPVFREISPGSPHRPHFSPRLSANLHFMLKHISSALTRAQTCTFC